MLIRFKSPAHPPPPPHKDNCNLHKQVQKKTWHNVGRKVIHHWLQSRLKESWIIKISQLTRRPIPDDAAVTANPPSKTSSTLEAAAGQERNHWRVLRNVSGFAAVLKHSSRREMLNEHQSKGSRGPHSEPEPSSPLSMKPQSGGWL